MSKASSVNRLGNAVIRADSTFDNHGEVDQTKKIASPRNTTRAEVRLSPAQKQFLDALNNQRERRELRNTSFAQKLPTGENIIQVNDAIKQVFGPKK